MGLQMDSSSNALLSLSPQEWDFPLQYCDDPSGIYTQSSRLFQILEYIEKLRHTQIVCANLFNNPQCKLGTVPVWQASGWSETHKSSRDIVAMRTHTYTFMCNIYNAQASRPFHHQNTSRKNLQVKRNVYAPPQCSVPSRYLHAQPHNKHMARFDRDSTAMELVR